MLIKNKTSEEEVTFLEYFVSTEIKKFSFPRDEK